MTKQSKRGPAEAKKRPQGLFYIMPFAIIFFFPHIVLVYVRQKERGINPHWDTVFESCRKHGQNVQPPQKALVQPHAALRQLAVCSWWTVLLIRKHWGIWGKPGTQISYLENLQNIWDFWFHAFSSVFYFCVVPSLLLTFPSGPSPALWGSPNS